MRRILFISALCLVFSPAVVYAAEVEKKIDALEKRIEELERGESEHKTVLEEIKGHVLTLESGLAMVDYRTARIKGMQEKVESFTIGGGLSLFMQGTSSGAVSSDSADGSYSADLFVEAPIGPYGNVYIRGMAGQGGGLVLPPMFSGPNADMELDAPTFEIAEAWYWTEFAMPNVLDRRLEFTIGKLTPASMFDANAAANNELAQFIADIFVNNLALEFGGDDNGYGAGASLGYRFTSIYNKGFEVKGRLGAFEGDGDFDGVFDRPFLMAELDVWRPYYGLDGNFRFYGWVNNSKHADLLNPADDELSNKGFGLSLDHEVSNDMTLFARYGFQDKDVSEFDQSFSAGGQLIGNRWRRGNDVLGLAYGFSHVGSPYKDATPAIDFASGEQYVEAYYRYRANPNLSISPDVQYVVNPGGDRDMDDVFIYAMRMQVDF